MPLTAAQKTAAARRAQKKKQVRQAQGRDARARGETFTRPTDRQLYLLRELEHEYELVIPSGLEEDYGYTKKLLDAFAYEPGNPTTGWRRITSLQRGVADGQDIGHMARKLEVREATVEFIIELLRSSGYDLEPVEENDREDPEEAYYSRIESAIA